MANIPNLIPHAEGDEYRYLDKLLIDLSDEKAHQFAHIYKVRRKDPQTILLLSLLGFFGIAGVHRFVLNQVGMGLLYFFTGGLCLIGVIVDIINHKDLTFQYNRTVAQEVFRVVNQ